MKPALFDGRGKVVLVTGAAGGIGRETVRLARASGAKVAAFDLARRGLPRESRDVLAMTGDAAAEADVRALVRDTVKRFGRIDAVVSAVGVVGAGRLDAMPLAEWHRLLDINLTSAFLLCRETWRPLKRARGSVVLFSSTNGRNGGSHLSGAAYAVAKAGIVNLTRYLAREWAPGGVRVNCIAPGPVDTPMVGRLTPGQHAALKKAIPLGRYATAAEVAATVAFLCSPNAASMTGTCINVSGGMVLD
jgi:3-oxoacyl-[acyl-carrier protein] reductase